MESVGFTVICKECEESEARTVMHGETGRCARVRCNEHYDALVRKKNSNLWEQCLEVNGGKTVDFRFNVANTFVRDPLTRQLDEARRILQEASRTDSTIMNDKLEWVRPAGVAISVSKM